MKFLKYSLSMLINGIISLVLGCIPMIYQANTPISGYQKGIDSAYNHTVLRFYSSVDRMKVLVAIGIVMLVLSVIFKVVKPKESKQTAAILMIVPFAVIVLYSIINYIPILAFQTIYN